MTPDAMYEGIRLAAIADGMTEEEAVAYAESHAGDLGSLGGGVPPSERQETGNPVLSDFPPFPGGGVPQQQESRAYKSLGTHVLRARSMPPMEWVIPSLLPVGLTLLAGPEKVGKSFISLDVAFGVAAGGRALSSLPCPQGRVLYMALEDHVQRIDERLKMTGVPEAEWPMEALSLVTSSESEGIAHLSPVMDQWYEEGPNAKLVILDTLNAYRSISMGTERGKQLARMSVTQAETALLRPIQSWALEKRLSVLVIHHTNKGKSEEGSDPFEAISGSRALNAVCDQAMLFRGQRGTAEGELVITGRDIPDAEYGLHRVGPWWTVMDSVRDPKLGDRTNDVIAFVNEADGPVSPKQVAFALGLDNKYVGTLLGEQVGKRVGRAGRGLYQKMPS